MLVGAVEGVAGGVGEEGVDGVGEGFAGGVVELFADILWLNKF